MCQQLYYVSTCACSFATVEHDTLAEFVATLKAVSAV